MSESLPPDVEQAFESHRAYERAGEGVRLTTTTLDGRVSAIDLPNGDVVYAVTVWAPTLQAATVDEIGQSVAQGWFETFELRLADAPMATRIPVDLEEFTAERSDDEIEVTYQFEMADPARAAKVSKTFVEYVEGTYVEGVIPGYEYEGAVAELVGDAQTGGADGDVGGTPL